ncbi:MAG: sugar transferase [Solirubrobacterales bacterium]
MSEYAHKQDSGRGPVTAAGGEHVARAIVPELEGSSLLKTRHSRRDRFTMRMLALGDATAIIVAVALAATFGAHRADPGELVLWALPTLPVWILLFKVYKLYDRYAKRISHTAVDDLPWMAHCLLVGSLLFWGYSKLLPAIQINLREGVIFITSALVLVLVGRAFMGRLVSGTLGAETVLLAGSSAQIDKLAAKLDHHPEIGLRPVGILDGVNPRPPEREALDIGLASYGGGRFDALAAELRPQRLIIDRSEFVADQVIAMIDTCRRLSIKVSILPDAVESLGPSVEVDAVQGVTLLGVNPPLLSLTSRAIKRGFDLLIASVILLVAAIPMALIAIAIVLDSGRPVFFCQRRIGRAGRPFEIFKFRSMCADAEQRRDEVMRCSSDPRTVNVKHDPRVTRVGRLLRMTSLDELPQLFNVIRGEMSLVGPRPLPEAEDRTIDGYVRGRLDLTPGISGLWQVLGRNDIPFDEMVKIDYMYVTNWSLWLDLRLMLQTLPAVFRRRGVN